VRSVTRLTQAWMEKRNMSGAFVISVVRWSFWGFFVKAVGKCHIVL
jgi:hypothetical protein